MGLSQVDFAQAWALANLAVDHKTNKTAIREGRGLAALVNLLRRQRAASPLAASSLRNYEGEALRERAAQGLDALCQGDAKNQEAVVLACVEIKSRAPHALCKYSQDNLTM